MLGHRHAARKSVITEPQKTDVLGTDVVEQIGRISRSNDLEFWLESWLLFLCALEQPDDLVQGARMQAALDIVEQDQTWWLRPKRNSEESEHPQCAIAHRMSRDTCGATRGVKDDFVPRYIDRRFVVAVPTPLILVAKAPAKFVGQPAYPDIADPDIANRRNYLDHGLLYPVEVRAMFQSKIRQNCGQARAVGRNARCSHRHDRRIRQAVEFEEKRLRSGEATNARAEKFTLQRFRPDVWTKTSLGIHDIDQLLVC